MFDGAKMPSSIAFSHPGAFYTIARQSGLFIPDQISNIEILAGQNPGHCGVVLNLGHFNLAHRRSYSAKHI